MQKDARLKKFFISIVLMFVITTVISTVVLSTAIIKRCEEYMLSETQALVAADAEQLGLNINAHLDGIEGNVALMFADDEIVEYDASTSELEQYDRINVETAITDRIVDLGALENYSDFCVVYANDNTVGWKSKTTQNIFADGGIYEVLSSYITNDKTQDGWAFGINGNIDRMYYVKRCNENAIIIASFYARELEKTFKYPDELQGMKVRLVSDKGYIVYSSEREEIGLPVSAEDRSYIEMGYATNAITDTQLVNTYFCENGWMLMCTVSRENMMQEFYRLKSFAILISAAIIIVAVVIMILLFARLCKPMDGYVEDLSEKATVDMLSGVLSRRGFKDLVEAAISNGNFKESAFIMLDIDNFKKINDTLGHDYGDEVITRMGKLLSDNVVENEKVKPIIGRLGGDEFAIFLGLSEPDSLEADHIIEQIIAKFKEEYSKEREQFSVSLSGGMALGSDTEGDYHSLYTAADSALYISKEKGKDQYNRYSKEETDAK